MIDNRGNPWKDVYDGPRLVERIDPLGNSFSLGYDPDLNVTSVTDPKGRTTSMTYDGRGNLLTRTAPAPLSYQESFTYNSNNDPTSYTDGRSNTTTFAYDAAGNLAEIREPGSITTEFGRDPGTGLVTSITDPRLKTTSFSYDATGNLTGLTRSSGAHTIFGYDSAGRMTSLVEARGNASGAAPTDFTWTITYDAADHLESVTDPLDNRTEWAFDAAGNLDWIKDAKSRTTGYVYLPNNLLKKIVAPDLSETVYGYDATSNLTSVTDANQNTTSYAYDSANRVASITLPNGQQWTYTYDKNGNIKAITDAEGNATPGDPDDGRTTIAYDVLNRPVAIDYSDATPDVYLTYDANSNRKTMTDGAGTESYDYDAVNRVTGVSRGVQGFSYEYDKSSNVTKRVYPDGTVVDYTYDDDGFVDSVSTGGKVTGYSYNPAGLLESTTLPAGNGHIETRTYDRAGRLSSLEHATASSILAKLVYSLDAAGNPVTITDKDGAVTTYSYDPDRDFLTEVCLQASCPGAGDPFIRYEYDPVGNRLKEIRPGGTDTYSYDASDRLQSVTGASGTTSFDHDRNGNMTQAGTSSYSYDLAGRMVSASDGSAATDYTYDGDGKRLSATSGPLPIDTTRYLWDPNWPLYQLVREEDGSGSLVRRYVHGNDLVSMTSDGSDYYFHHDGLGSVTDVTDASGAAQWKNAYEPFGTRTAQVQLDISAPENVMLFTGELFDASTDLYHLRARQYGPGIGSFLQQDPWPSNLGQPHLGTYVYSNGRPTSYVDPSGLFGIPGAIIGGFIGALGGAATALVNGGEASEVLSSALLGGVEGAVLGGFGPAGAAATTGKLFRTGARVGVLADLGAHVTTGSGFSVCSTVSSSIYGGTMNVFGHGAGRFAKFFGANRWGQGVVGGAIGVVGPTGMHNMLVRPSLCGDPTLAASADSGTGGK